MQNILKSKLILGLLYFCFLAGVTFFSLINYPLTGFDSKIFEIFVVLILFLSAFGVGNKLVKFLNINAETNEEIIFSIGIGLGFYSISFLLLGVLNLFYPIALISFISIFAIASVKEIRTLLSGFYKSIPTLLNSQFKSNDLFLIVPALIFAVIGLLICFAPPTYYDSIVYHLALPDIYLREHAINKINYNFFSNFPENIEMLFSIGLALGDDIIPNLISFSLCILTSLIIFLAGKRFLTPKSTKTALMLFFITPSVILLGTSTYIEMGLCFFIMLALLSYINYAETNNDSFIVLAGIFSGLALGTKYTAGMSIIAIIVLLILEKKWVKILKFIAVSGLVFLPWGLKNLFFTGDPLYPFLQKLVYTTVVGPSKEITNGYFALFNQYSIQTGYFEDLVKFPYLIVTEGTRFAGGFDVLGGLGWTLFLGFIPTLFFIKKYDKITITLIIYFVVYFLLWFSSKQVLRFLVPVIPILCLLCGKGISSFVSGNKFLNKAIAAVFLIIMFFSNLIVLATVFEVTEPFKVALGLETRDFYLSRKLNYYPAVKFMNNTLPRNSKILYLGGEQRGYYCKRNYTIAHPFAPNFFTELLNTSPGHYKPYGVLKQQGYTHLFLNLPEVNRLQGGPASTLNENGKKNSTRLIKEFTKTIYAKGDIFVFELK
ncbi:MAG: glycosyltransferase family 39 protein [Elusimicrobia bacterium]|nr:glycosyltransferase family 39 protein [Elusimicrobiota bacterium]